jgi:hypothetical protein
MLLQLVRSLQIMICSAVTNVLFLFIKILVAQELKFVYRVPLIFIIGSSNFIFPL